MNLDNQVALVIAVDVGLTVIAVKPGPNAVTDHTLNAAVPMNLKVSSLPWHGINGAEIDLVSAGLEVQDVVMYSFRVCRAFRDTLVDERVATFAAG